MLSKYIWETNRFEILHQSVKVRFVFLHSSRQASVLDRWVDDGDANLTSSNPKWHLHFHILREKSEETELTPT